MQNSRRNFLSSMAILSAGAAFGSVTRVFPPGNSAKDLKKLWNLFCTQNNGYPVLESMADKTVMDTCKGHYQKNGEMVFFSQEKMLAQPTWIYWGENKSQPFDVIVTFYQSDQEQTKAFRINRFELEALTELSTDFHDSRIMADLHESKMQGSRNGDHQIGLVVKTNIQKGKYVKIFAAHSSNKITIDSKLIYNT